MGHRRSADLAGLRAVSNADRLAAVDSKVWPWPKIIMLNAVIVGLIDRKVDRQNHSQITFAPEETMIDPVMEPQDVNPSRFSLLVGGGIINDRRIGEATMPGFLAQPND